MMAYHKIPVSVRRVFLIWLAGILSICLLLRFGPVSSFLPEPEVSAEEEELTSEEEDSDSVKESHAARDPHAKEKTGASEEKRPEEGLPDPEASFFQILMICAAMTVMLLLALFLWGEISVRVAAYIAVLYTVLSLPMLSGFFFAASIMVDHAAWMLWVFRMPRLRRQMSHVQGNEYFKLFLNAFLMISGYCLIHYYGGVENLDFVTYIGLSVYSTGFLGAAHILYLIRLYRGNRYSTSRMLIAGAFFFSFSCILNRQDLYFAAGLVLCLALLVYYLVKDEPGMLDFMERAEAVSPGNYRRKLAAAAVLAVLAAVYFGGASIARYRTFHASNFDLGIFAQMYEYMARTGIPLTTTERGFLLSHLYIHFSPVYYLFLPIYIIFRSVESLLALQALMVFAGVVPLFLICRHYRLKSAITFLVSCIYLLFPAIGQPLFFDFHENKFIPFFVLWFLYFYLEKKDGWALLFLFLSLGIKEDTSIFIMVFALYRIVGKKEFKKGGILLAISAVYFAAVMLFIGSHGHGLVEGHYSMYYLEGESGLFALARNILLEPGRFLNQVFDRENLGYIFCTLGALMFLPLFSRDKYRLILLIPYVAFALMTSYPSQHDVGYQYTYGPAVLMLLLFIINLSELEKSGQYIVCVTAVCACLVMSYAYRGAESYRYFTEYYADREVLSREEYLLDSIPAEASVVADGLITAHLSHVYELYEYDPEEDLRKTDYYILFKDVKYRKFKRQYERLGYKLTGTAGDILVYQKK